MTGRFHFAEDRDWRDGGGHAKRSHL